MDELQKRAENLEHYVELMNLEKLMEEMANAPREPMGKKQPGEKQAYEKDYKCR